MTAEGREGTQKNLPHSEEIIQCFHLLSLNPRILFFSLVTVAVLIEAAADVLFKKWAIGGSTTSLVLGLLAYTVGTVFWAVSLKVEFLSKAIVLFTLLNLVIVALMGVILFQEQLSFTNKMGIVLAFVSIVLLES